MDSTPDARIRLDVIDTCNAMAWHADRRDWPRLLAVFADDVELDYTSLNGGEPATMPKAAVVAGWRGLFEQLTATQHLLTGHLVTISGERAVCTANFQAVHVGPTAFGTDQWVLGGHYRFDLTQSADGWLITALVMTAVWATGNGAVMATATAAQGSAS